MSGRVRLGLLSVPALFLGILFAWPIVAILTTSLRVRGGGGWDVGHALATLTSSSTRHVLGFTVLEAGLSTVATVAAALPAAWVLGRIDVPGRGLYRVAVTIPFVLPTVVVAAAFLALAGPQGVLAPHVRIDGSLTAIVAAHAFFNYAVVARIVGGQWARLDPRPEEAARALGAGAVRVFLTVTLPRLRAALTSAAVLTFLFCSTSYGVVVLLGGQAQATLETAIARAALTGGDRPAAAALAVLQLAAVATLLAVETSLRDRRAGAVGLVPEVVAVHRPRHRRERWAVAAAIGSTVVLLGSPLVVLAERSLHVGGGYGFGWYRSLGASGGRASVVVGSPWSAVRTSLGYAAGAALVALLVGGAAAVAVAARRDRTARVADTALALPLGASAVTVGFGFLVALDRPPFDLRDSTLLVPLAHALIGIPFVVRAVAPALRSIDPRLRAAAQVLGASPARVWRDIDLALVGRPLLVATGFAFAISLGEFGATSVLARADHPTVTVAIGRLLGHPGAASFGQAAAMSVVLLALTAAAVTVFDRGRIGAVGSF